MVLMFTKSRFFLTAYPPPLVNVVCERPLKCSNAKTHRYQEVHKSENENGEK